MSGSGRPAADMDRRVARIITIGTYLSVVLLGIGVLLMVATSVSPLDPAPPFDLQDLVPALVAGRPVAYLWLGLVAVIATPSARVAASLLGFLRDGERMMALVAAGILGVIALSVLLAIGLEG